MKTVKWSVLSVVLTLWSVLASAQIGRLEKELDGRFNFYVVNDMGRNGYYDQKPIAEKMGELAEVIGPEFVAAVGDVHHFEGVASVSDPLWMTNYELIYSHPELMLYWFPVLGNHEYNGNTQAVLDYAKISRRWCMEDRYYTKEFTVDKAGTTIRLVFVDTAPMIDKYRNGKEEYPDAGKQDMSRQFEWIDSVLTVNKATWTIVLGHHPVYAETGKTESERLDMQKRLNPILKKHKVDMYVCGHIHNFQHIRREDSPVDYIVNTAGALSRKVKATEGTQFCSGATGFSVCSASDRDLRLYMLDKDGNVLYVVERKK